MNKSVKPNAIGASLSRSNLLIGGLFSTKANNEAKIIALSDIDINREQPRRSINTDRLNELAEDIKQHGVLQPLIVRPVPSPAESDQAGAKVNQQRYQLVVGERRFRAAQIAGLSEVPVIIREYGDQEAGAVSLVENLLREDLDLEEEALFFKKLTDEFQLSTRDIGRLISKGHLYVYRRLKLLERPDLLKQVQETRLNLNKAVDMILEEQAEIQAAKGEVRARSGPRRKPSEPDTQVAWKKLTQFTAYLRDTLPKFEIQDDKDREGLKETVSELEQQLAELKRRLEAMPSAEVSATVE
jgi:ParB/RepB/Spo0J family partition protein